MEQALPHYKVVLEHVENSNHKNGLTFLYLDLVSDTGIEELFYYSQHTHKNIFIVIKELLSKEIELTEKISASQITGERGNVTVHTLKHTGTESPLELIKSIHQYITA